MRSPVAGRVAVDRRRVMLSLSVVAAGLVAASVAGDAYLLATERPPAVAVEIVDLVDLDAETNLPTFFSVGLMLGAAALLAVIGSSTGPAGRPSGRWWFALAVVFVGLAFDELASVHETQTLRFRGALGGPSIFWFGWVVPAAVLVGAFVVTFARFLRDLGPPSARLFVTAGAVYVVGALGVELVEGAIAARSGEDNVPYVVALTAQELLEMAGMILFVDALLRHLAARGPELSIRVG